MQAGVSKSTIHTVFADFLQNLHSNQLKQSTLDETRLFSNLLEDGSQHLGFMKSLFSQIQSKSPNLKFRPQLLLLNLHPVKFKTLFKTPGLL